MQFPPGSLLACDAGCVAVQILANSSTYGGEKLFCVWSQKVVRGHEAS